MRLFVLAHLVSMILILGCSSTPTEDRPLENSLERNARLAMEWRENNPYKPPPIYDNPNTPPPIFGGAGNMRARLRPGATCENKLAPRTSPGKFAPRDAATLVISRLCDIPFSVKGWNEETWTYQTETQQRCWDFYLGYLINVESFGLWELDQGDGTWTVWFPDQTAGPIWTVDEGTLEFSQTFKGSLDIFNMLKTMDKPPFEKTCRLDLFEVRKSPKGFHR